MYKMKIFITCVVLLSFASLCNAVLNDVVLTKQESSWKRFTATWTAVAQATIYETSLNCTNFNATSNTTTLITISYKKVPTNQSCTFTIVAKNGNNNEESPVKTYQFQSTASPAAPSNFSIEQHPDEPSKQLFITWTHPTSLSTERLQSIRYQITYKDSPTTTGMMKKYGIVLTDYGATNYTLLNLEENTIYWIQVATYDEFSKETGQSAAGQKLTDNPGISNLLIAMITIAVTTIIIVILSVVTYTHFKSKYGKI